MTNRQELIVKNVEAHKQMILDAERWLWAHPQVGFTEWEANRYLTEKFEAMGYELVQADSIPGFYTDVDTGNPGPHICIMAELDALDISTHPEAVNGMSHACGHHAQCAALLGIAAALKESYALDGLSGKIRLMAVPAEELIQLEWREEMRKKGVIKYFGGKVEFMSRGYFDGIDLCILLHGTAAGPDEAFDFRCDLSKNGCMAKTIKYKGKASHAAGGPHLGVNAQYAAMLGLQACNDLRETFQDNDTVRFHPIMMGVTSAVNIIPDEMKIESFVRGKTIEVIKQENKKINRALTGAALAMGAGVELCDRPGYAPEYHDPAFMRLFEQCCIDLVGADRVRFDYTRHGTGSCDFGDLTCVMPGVQPYCAGAVGNGHSVHYFVKDPVRQCVNSAKVQLFVTEALLENGATAAKKIVADYKPQYSSIKEYLATLDDFFLDKDAVKYDENGVGSVDYQN